MSFSGLVLTNSGKGELVKCGLGQPFQITDIVFGSGQYNGTGTNIKELVNQVMSLPATSVERDSQNEDVVRVECDFNSTDVPRPFFWREIGIIANGKLCYYDNSRDDAEYIDPESETIVKQKRMRFLLMISSEVNVRPVIGSSLYAEKKDVQEVLYPNFAEATERENIASGEKISILFGKIRKWFSDLKTVAFTGNYDDLTNKPSIPSVGNGTVTITQNGITKGSFTTNQSGNATIALTDTNTQTVTGVKGNAESSYRTNNVNLTPANIGALPSANVVNNNTTTVAGYALDARQANPNVAGSLGAQIASLKSGKLTISKYGALHTPTFTGGWSIVTENGVSYTCYYTGCCVFLSDKKCDIHIDIMFRDNISTSGGTATTHLFNMDALRGNLSMSTLSFSPEQTDVRIILGKACIDENDAKTLLSALYYTANENLSFLRFTSDGRLTRQYWSTNTGITYGNMVINNGSTTFRYGNIARVNIYAADYT